VDRLRDAGVPVEESEEGKGLRRASGA